MILIIHCTIRLGGQHWDNVSTGKFLKSLLKSQKSPRCESPDSTKPLAFVPLETILENQARHAL